MDGWKRPASRRPAQLFSQGRRLFGSEIETKHLDGDETIAGGLVGAKDGTKCPNAYLMQHPEWAERWWGREASRIVSGQRGCSFNAIRSRIEKM